MTGKRIGGVVCLVLAVALLVSGVMTVTAGNGPAVTDGSGLGVSHAVGAFLPFLLALTVGLWLLQKPKAGRK